MRINLPASKLRVAKWVLIVEFSLYCTLQLQTLAANPPNPQPSPSSSPKVRSTEWRDLPKQSWELTVALPDNPHPLKTLDPKSRLRAKRPVGFEPFYFPSTHELDSLGEIVASTKDSLYLSTKNLVFISAASRLEIGATYAITSTPTMLKAPKSGRKGYSYLIAGKVTVTALRDDLYVGTITNTKDLISRGTFLIPLPPKVLELTPIPAPQALEGTVMIDHRDSTYSSGQHKEVYVDRGSEDGIKPGMIFRVFNQFDPGNGKKITDSDLTIVGDLIVTQVSKKHSSALVIHTHDSFNDFSRAVLLTDVTDVKKYPEFNSAKDPNEEDLDHLDDGIKMKEEERKKLKQMRNWKGKTLEPDSSADSLDPSPASDLNLSDTPEDIPPPQNDPKKRDDSTSTEDPFNHSSGINGTEGEEIAPMLLPDPSAPQGGTGQKADSDLDDNDSFSSESNQKTDAPTNPRQDLGTKVEEEKLESTFDPDLDAAPNASNDGDSDTSPDPKPDTNLDLSPDTSLNTSLNTSDDPELD